MKVILYILGSLVGLYLLVITIVPGIVENQHNEVALSPPYFPGEEAQELHESLDFVADLHSDALLWDRNLLKKSKRGHVDIPRLQEANSALQVFTLVTKTPKNQNYASNTGDTDNITLLQIVQGNAVGTWFSLKDRALRQADKLQDMADQSEGTFTVIHSREDLQEYIVRRNENTSLTSGILGVEGAHMLEQDTANLREAFNAGIRILAPVHFFDNELGGSAHGVDKGGLTAFGREVIQISESLGIIIDLSHASSSLVEDVLDMASRPVIVTHTGVRGTCDNVRNLSDEQLRRIAANEGLIGIAMFEQAVCGNDAAATARAIRYTADLIGWQHVALGSDFDGAVRAHFDVTGLPLITEALMNEGFSRNEIAGIMGENARRFFLQNLPSE